MKMFDEEGKILPEAIAKLYKMQQVHYDSTTPMDAYFTGLYNGIEYAIYCLTGQPPEFKKPEK